MDTNSAALAAGTTLTPQVAGEFFGHGGAVFGPFAGEEGGPVGGGGEAFVIGEVEAELDGEAAFAEGGVGFEGEAVLEFQLGFGLAGSVGNFQGGFIGAGDG